MLNLEQDQRSKAKFFSRWCWRVGRSGLEACWSGNPAEVRPMRGRRTRSSDREEVALTDQLLGMTHSQTEISAACFQRLSRRNVTIAQEPLALVTLSLYNRSQKLINEYCTDTGPKTSKENNFVLNNGRRILTSAFGPYLP